MKEYYIKDKVIKQIEKEAKMFFKAASGCHDWSHVERVRELALRIGKKEKARPDILEIASLLHDIGRKKEMKNKGLFCHAEEGGKLAKFILKRHGIREDDIKNIIHCIVSHRFRNSNIPETIEAKVLFDADKLDSIGAIGVARNFLFAGNAGSKTLYTGNEKRLAKEKKDYAYTKEDSAILEYEIKLKHIKDKMLTKEGNKIAKERHEFMVDFHNRFEKEIKGIL